MARYRKVDPRIWNDEKFRALSDAGKLAFLFVLTHPHMTALGAMRATLSGLAEEIGWTPDAGYRTEAFREALGEAFAKAMAKHDPKACFLWLPNFLKYNRPESPNVVKAWGESLDLLPECGLKWQLIQHVKAFAEGMTEAFGKALPEAFAKAMPYQEQEQEQEQNKKENPLSPLERGNGALTRSERRPRPIRDQGRQAWERVLEAARRGQSTAGDPLIDDAVRRMGGYVRIGQAHESQRSDNRARFRELYEELLERQQQTATAGAA